MKCFRHDLGKVCPECGLDRTKVTIKPINNRFKNLIAKFGSEWIVISGPFSMYCFNGQAGGTCKAANDHRKTSNFKITDVEFL